MLAPPGKKRAFAEWAVVCINCKYGFVLIMPLINTLVTVHSILRRFLRSRVLSWLFFLIMHLFFIITSCSDMQTDRANRAGRPWQLVSVSVLVEEKGVENEKSLYFLEPVLPQNRRLCWLQFYSLKEYKLIFFMRCLDVIQISITKSLSGKSHFIIYRNI